MRNALLCFLMIGTTCCAASAFADQGQKGWACFTSNRTTGQGGRWWDESSAVARRTAIQACESGGRYSCILVKCVPVGSKEDDGCPECYKAH
jgi:hypothetical protein